MNKKVAYILLSGIIACIIINCSSVKMPAQTIEPQDTIPRQQILETAPIVSPQQSLSLFTIEEGFDIELVASEPLVSTPVALNFDNKNRMWVVEMQGYMPNAEGTGEERPNGKIVIIEDTDRDGVADSRKVFLDSLVLPRAICLIENGILVAEPPRLWYYKIVNDKPGKKILIDEAYTEGGNVEAQSNGLFRAMDNWIYSGGSEKRYRKKGDKWLIERTHLRGQWGISQDDFGRLFYNNNSQNLLGDFFAPGLGAHNTNLRSVNGFKERLISDNRVFPARPTPGVNRGYKENILDDSLRLQKFTAACGPVIYRGDLFDKQYYNNAFVAEPAANLIKRNVIQENGYTVTGKQAYEGKEFLTSIDERFRPVSLYNGPDGALYVVDMYRGIIQHKSFLTDYLKKQVEARNLAAPVDCGRIYKIIPKNSAVKPVMMPSDPAKLVKLLQHENGWVRDKAQQMLVDDKNLSVVSDLRRLLKSADSRVIAHALWTMEGLEALKSADIIPLMKHGDWKVRAQALSVLPSVVDAGNYKEYVPVLEQMSLEKDTLTAPYLAFQIRLIDAFDKASANRLLTRLSIAYAGDAYVADAILTNLKDKETLFSKQLAKLNPDSSLINKRLKKVMADISSDLKNKDINVLRRQFPRGYSLYSSTCQPCHGTDGNGVEFLAPPLNNSEWVTGKKDKAIAILLFGLTGPIKVNHKVYKAPEINGDMPGLGSNKDIVDEDIAQLLSFIRNAWNNTAPVVTREEVIEVRKRFNSREKPFTAEELEKF
ncbi:MAG TPA: c-type cytochrome [Sphingobacteriaceae bacterium]